LFALALLACNSTGVGNPAPASLQLSITRDDELVAAVGGAADAEAAGGADQERIDGGGMGMQAEGGATNVSATTDGGATTAGGVTTAGGAAMTEGGTASESTALPRAAIEDALLLIGEVRFLPCDLGESAVIAPGPFLVDLVRGGTSPGIPAVPVPSGGFCGLDAPLVPARAPSRLIGRSVYFGGTRADGTPFRFYANVQATLRVRARTGIRWQAVPESTRSVFWALRPRQWLEPSELDALETAELDGTGAIDIERHPALLRAIRARLAGRSTLYDDANDDDMFDDGDRAVALGDGIANAD
jgi:hypothetical protein